MTYSISEKRELWKKVGEKDVKIYEFDCAFITPNVCVLWNKPFEMTDVMFDKLIDFIKNMKMSASAQNKKEAGR